MAIGHFLMASEQMFFVALVFLILGNGCFKPNISTQIGGLYTDDDPRRDRAFGIFYMGINLGAIFSPLVCGTLGEVFGWHYGFAAAGVGMLVGLVFYLIGQRDLGPDQFQSQQTRTPLTADQRKVVGALVMLCLLNIIYWAVYEQQANTMQLWADEKINWTYLGITIPSTWYQSFNPVMVVALVPLLARFWSWQSSRDREPSSVSKMAIGALLLALAFGFIIFGVKVIGTGTGNVLWLVIGTLILSIGEVYLSPIGLSLVSKAAPRQIMSMMMGMWFLSSFAGGFLSGYIGSYYERMTQENFFLMLAALALVTSLAMWAFNKPIRRALGNHGE
jgi:POT family proton-dependent oligopeptide transporter